MERYQISKSSLELLLENPMRTLTLSIYNPQTFSLESLPRSRWPSVYHYDINSTAIIMFKIIINIDSYICNNIVRMDANQVWYSHSMIVKDLGSFHLVVSLLSARLPSHSLKCLLNSSNYFSLPDSRREREEEGHSPLEVEYDILSSFHSPVI